MTSHAHARDLTLTEFAKVLRRAAEIVEQGWCQGSKARDCLGRQVHPLSPVATQWCEAGAVHVAMAERGFRFGAQAADGWWWSDLTKHVDAAGLSWPLNNVLGALYNDVPGRTAGEVAAHLRAGAARLESFDS